MYPLHKLKLKKFTLNYIEERIVCDKPYTRGGKL